MCRLGAEVREKTDALDAAGNTTAAIGKGFAIGSAALVSFALFGAFVTRTGYGFSGINILDPGTLFGLLIGAMTPYIFSAMTMKSVGNAASEMSDEVKKQINQYFNDNSNVLDKIKSGSIKVKNAKEFGNLQELNSLTFPLIEAVDGHHIKEYEPN